MRVERGLIEGIDAHLMLGSIERTLIASRALCLYFLHALWPARLSFFYERFLVDATDAGQWLFPIAVLVAGTALTWLARRRRGPLAMVLIFGGTLVPVLGFVSIEWFVFAFVADHFQYVANLSLIIGGAAIVSRFRTAIIAASVAIALLGVATWRYSAVFRSNIALYANVVARSPGSAVAHHHYADALAKDPARLTEAAAQFEAALRINPDAADVHANLGDVLLRVPGRAGEGIAHLETAVRLKPQLALARRKLAAAHFDLGKSLAADPAQTLAAITEYEQALWLDPNFAEAHYNLGNALMRLPDRTADAQAHFEAAVRLKPDFPEAHTNLGTLLARTPGRLPEAIVHFEAALHADPNFTPARNNLERARRLLGER
jgi:tetratricopeptide (TPR) repeat protein